MVDKKKTPILGKILINGRLVQHNEGHRWNIDGTPMRHATDAGRQQNKRAEEKSGPVTLSPNTTKVLKKNARTEGT